MISLKIALKNLGCKVNQIEGGEVLARLPAGFQIVSWKEKADVYLINTCTVTQIADRKSRQAIRQVKKYNPQAKVVVLGCGARGISKNQQGLKDLSEIDFLEADLGKIGMYLRGLEKERLGSARKRSGSLSRKNSAKSLSPTRAFVKVQDGCNNFCTYCIVPWVRGRSQSRPIKTVLADIYEKEQAGYKEIVLSGINLGAYQDGEIESHGHGLTSVGIYASARRERVASEKLGLVGPNFERRELIKIELADLMEKILTETKVPRIRLSSLQPQNFSPKFIEIFKNDRVCPHLHLSLQSGSEKILKKMGRPYTARDYLAMTRRLKQIKPNLALTTDIIVGFPGETEEDFQDSVEIAREVGFSKIHVFPFSARPGTKAADFKSTIPYSVKQQRSAGLRALSDELGQQFREREIGQTRQVLFEEKKGDFWVGFTENYLKVQVKSKNDLRNEIRTVQILRNGEEGELKKF